MIKRAVKHAVASVLASEVLAPAFEPLVRGVATILMMHRFADRDRGNTGHDPQQLRTQLALLRRRRFDLVSLSELVRRLRDRDSRLKKTVAFTVDDGYADYATVGAGVFEEFDCPATVFVVTGVVDCGEWYWWDRIRVGLETSPRRSMRMEVGGSPVESAWSNEADVGRVSRALVDALKRVTDEERRHVLDALPSVLDTDIPVTPPPKYAPMTWDEVRACGRRLTSFGPHTVSHPILSRTGDAQSRREVEESWLRLREETEAAIGVFCYPNGTDADFGAREISTLRDVGIQAAVTSRPDYSSPGVWHDEPDGRFRLPRFPYGETRNELVQVVGGVERMKAAVRRARAR
jgi:peptidoglycan/xylan/chitin deacetylase (PgdA/CDA1 family)